MNRSAIDDLLRGILSGWYESVAEWMPPGQGSRLTCTSCSESLLAEILAVREWPHDLVHQLASSLEAAVQQIVEAHETAGSSLTVTPSEEAVRLIVTRTVSAHAGDIVDVLDECVTPRLDEYAAFVVARVLSPVE